MILIHVSFIAIIASNRKSLAHFIYLGNRLHRSADARDANQ